ncbi:hypothetical protein BDD12DRAFT_98802 [Trichophaea hybrida]|nr:hypothetical protein BDD12DRAFT_98802 [Trichophaea hybrida]
MGRGERTHALSTTHLEMCRFKSPTDPGLVCIVACIKRLCTDPNNVVKLDERYAIPMKPPFPRNVHFCAREGILEEIQSIFWPNYHFQEDQSHPLGRKSITLQGSGGTGKTQVLLEHMYRFHAYKRGYSSIFWLNSDSVASLEASAYDILGNIIGHYDGMWRGATDCDQRIAHSLKIFEPSITTRATLMEALNKASSVKILRDWLSHEPNSRWLLVLDNYSPDVDLHTILPATDVGHVLVSTRSYNAYPGSHSIAMPDSIGEAESVDLLIRSSGKGLRVSRNDMAWASTIVKTIGQLPLALDQVGAYICSLQISLQKYAKLLKSEPERQMNEKITNTIHLGAIWEISWSKLSEKAKGLLQLCSLLSAHDIPLKLLQGGKRDIGLMIDDETITETIGCLLSFSFASVSPDDTSISIPPLVHTWIQQRLEQDEKALQQYRELVTYMLTSSFVFDDAKTLSEWSYERQILPHIIRCTEIVESQSNWGGKSMDDRSKEVVCSLAKAYERLSDPQKACSLYKLALNGVKKPGYTIQDFKTMDAYGMNLALQGKHEEALNWYTQALEGAESTVGMENILVLSIVLHIATVFMEQGQYDQAAEQYQRVLLVQEKKYGKDHLKTLETLYRLAVTYIHQENHDAALELLHKVRDVRERSPSLGNSHPSTLETLESIAKVLEKQAKYHEALEIHHSVVDRKVSSLGENHHSTLETVDGIASMYARQEMWNEALDWNGKLLDGLSKLFGAGNVKHPWTFSTFTRIADVHHHLGKYHDAEKGYKKAYAGFKDLGIETKELETAIKIGTVLRKRGHYTEALSCSRTAEKELEKKLGRDHTSTLAAVLNVASIFDMQGNYAEAFKRYQQVLTLYTKLSGPQHPDSLATTSAIANILTKQGAFQKASQLYTSTQPTQEKVLGPNHPQTLSTIQGHAILLSELGKYDHSIQLQERVVTAVSNALGISHPETHIATYHLAVAVENKGQLTEASKCYNQVISGLPAQHPYVLLATRGMGNIHLLSQRYEQAYSLYQRATSGLKEMLGDKHPETLRAVTSQALALMKMGRLEESESMYRDALGSCGETLGAEHPLTLTAVHGLAQACKKRKKFKEATAGFRRAKEGREKVFSKAHRDTEESRRALVKVKRRSWGWFF